MAKEKKKQSVKRSYDQHLLFHLPRCHTGFGYGKLCGMAAS